MKNISDKAVTSDNCGQRTLESCRLKNKWRKLAMPAKK